MRAGVKLFQWCDECGRVTEHGVAQVLARMVRFCRVHQPDPWAGLLPPLLPDPGLVARVIYKTFWGMGNNEEN